MINKTFRTTLLFTILVELISLSAFLLPRLMPIAFMAIVIIVLILSFRNLEYGVLILLAELFIGSKGHLFVLEFSGITMSIRVALWLIIMSVWLSKYIVRLISQKSFNNEYFNVNWLKKNIGPYFLILFVFIVWGFVNGFLQGNRFNNIFFDVNGWLFFSLMLPIYSVYNPSKTAKNDNEILKNLSSVFLAAISWLSFKTLLLLYLFSHNFFSVIFKIYRWVRVSGVGEITQMQGGFYRIFFQSHIFVLIGFIIIIWLLTVSIQKQKKINFSSIIKNNYFLAVLSAIFMAVNIISFSRSNWVGLAAGVLISSLLVLFYYRLRGFITYIFSVITTGVFALIIIIIIVKFPLPDPLGGFDAGSLLRERATRLTGEAAMSSRWALFPEIWKRIKDEPMLGAGFGASVSYISSDPRVLAQNPSGEYTTTAFEWGWLDIWLKLGLFGLVIYIALIIKLFTNALSAAESNAMNFPDLISPAIAVGLVVIAVVSFFSPYLNHPLGIGYLLLVSAIIKADFNH